MHVNLVGINHRTAPVAIRERVAIGTEKLSEALVSLQKFVSHGVILSTCNRTEVYTIDDNGQEADRASIAFLESQLDIPDLDLRKYIYSIADRAAVEHLYSVACGLDSMVVGEYEVLGQVRYALDEAEAAGTVNLPLRHIFQNAVRTGRKVREETGISHSPLSASSVAVDLAEDTVGDLSVCKLMVIGAGDAGRLAALVARNRGVSQIVVANRTRDRAADLAADLDGIPLGLEEMVRELSDTDIVIACSGAPHWILSAYHVAEAMAMRPDRPMVLIDIAVPRDIEPTASKLDNVFLHNIDDLTKITDLNRQQREGSIKKVKEIVTAEVDRFASWWQGFAARPVISALMSKAEDIRLKEMNRTLKKLRPLSEEEHYSVDAMTRSIISKILKEPIKCLKMNVSRDGDYSRMVNTLFGLQKDK